MLHLDHVMLTERECNNLDACCLASFRKYKGKPCQAGQACSQLTLDLGSFLHWFNSNCHMKAKWRSRDTQLPSRVVAASTFSQLRIHTRIVYMMCFATP